MTDPGAQDQADRGHFEVVYRRDSAVRFTHPIMSAAHAGKEIAVSQSLSGNGLFLRYGDDRYCISVEELVVAWLEAIGARKP